MRRRLLLAAAVLAASLLATGAPASAATATDLAPVASDAPLSAYGGYVAWSEQGADGLWRLVAFHDGTTTPLPVAPRSVPFDADVGPDATGRPTVTFSRCAPEPDFTSQQPWAAARGCRLRAVALPGGGERGIAVPRTGASDSMPSVWGQRVAFQRRARGAGVSQIMMYDFMHRRLKTLPHGAVPHGCPYSSGCPKQEPTAEVGELDLGARAVAYSWHLAAPGVEGAGAGWELRLAPTGAGRRSILAGNGYVSGACGARTPYSPNVVGEGVLFLSRWYHCEAVEGTLTSTSFAGGGLLSRTDDVGGGVAWRIAVDAASGTTYAVLGPARRDTQTTQPAAGALRLVRLDGVRPAPTRRRATEPFVTG
jgi:hypothetical protein